MTQSFSDTYANCPIVAFIDAEHGNMTVQYRDRVITTDNHKAGSYIMKNWVRVFRSLDRMYFVYMPRNGRRNLHFDGRWSVYDAWSIQCGVGEKLALIEGEG